MVTTKTKLNEILEKNGNYVKVKEEVLKFIDKLTKIEKGAKKAALGATDTALIGQVVKSAAARNGSDAGSVKNLVEGIKGIVDLVIMGGDGQADKTKPVDNDKKNIGRLFGAKNAAIAAANADAKKDGKVKRCYGRCCSSFS